MGRKETKKKRRRRKRIEGRRGRNVGGREKPAL